MSVTVFSLVSDSTPCGQTAKGNHGPSLRSPVIIARPTRGEQWGVISVCCGPVGRPFSLWEIGRVFCLLKLPAHSMYLKKAQVLHVCTCSRNLGAHIHTHTCIHMNGQTHATDVRSYLYTERQQVRTRSRARSKKKRDSERARQRERAKASEQAREIMDVYLAYNRCI
jgi:hypothetical protein